MGCHFCISCGIFLSVTGGGAMSLVSVIVPVYNVEQYLRECLDSILNQTFQDMEIICINDGSTDNSKVILDEYAQKDSRIVVINQENKGQGNARNAGLKVASGKYIAFVDSDDWIDKEMLSSTVPFLADNVDVVIFNVNIFGGIDEPMKKYFYTGFRGKSDLDGSTIYHCPATPWNKIYRKDIIDKYEVLFPEGLLFEDNSFHWKYLMHAKKAYFMSQKFYNYRIRKGSTMTIVKLRSARINDHFLVCQEIFEYMKKYDLTKKYSSFFPKFFKHCITIALSYTSNQKKSLEIANYVWSKIDIPVNDDIICALKYKNYNYIIKWSGYTFSEKIFSIKKRFYGEKIITICGIQFPFKRQV
jgi:glycosyltransferase involved in cell wall biosynthesis